jgi:hypothetical protein
LVRLWIHDLPHSLYDAQFKTEFAALQGFLQNHSFLLTHQDTLDPEPLKKILDALPKSNYETLKRLAVHMHVVIQRSSGNLQEFQFGSLFGGFHRDALPVILSHIKDLYDVYFGEKKFSWMLGWLFSLWLACANTSLPCTSSQRCLHLATEGSYTEQEQIKLLQTGLSLGPSAEQEAALHLHLGKLHVVLGWTRNAIAHVGYWFYVYT